MLRQIKLILADPTLRMVSFAILLFGVFIASIGLYQSLIAIRFFHISAPAYSLILMMSLIVSVTASVGIGILTDQRPNRRVMALATSVLMMLGAGTVWIGASVWAFALAHMFLIPLSGTLFGQLFAVGRLGTAQMPRAERDGILAIIRATFAVPFVIVLPIWGWLFDANVSLLTVYPAVMIAALLLFILIWRDWPADADAPWVEVKSGLNFRASLREMTEGSVFLRVMLVGAIHTGNALCGVILSLVLTDIGGRNTSDVGVFFGLFIAIEVVVTLLIGDILRYLSRLTVMAIGTFTYGIFIALLPFLAESPLVWILIVPAGAGGAMIFALAIGYLQDLMGSRAGAGTSLVALQRISTDSLSAGIFAFGTWIQGYHTVALLGAAASIGAIATIMILDRKRLP